VTAYVTLSSRADLTVRVTTSSGKWFTTLAVPVGTPPGQYTLTADCTYLGVNVPQEQQGLGPAYQDVTITVALIQ